MRKVSHITEVEGVIKSHAPPLSITAVQFAVPDPDYTPILLLKACSLPLSPIYMFILYYCKLY
jgi:hypothetical protein